MSISNLSILSLSILFFITLLQISKAQNTEVQVESLLNIVNPAEIAGTEVLLKDL
jgi:hypothetical protein